MSEHLGMRHVAGLQWALDAHLIGDLVTRKHVEQLIAAVRAHDAAGFCGDPYVHDCSRLHCHTSDSYHGPAPALVLPTMAAMRCQACNSPRTGESCHKCGGPLTPKHPSWEEPALPPVDRIRELAREVGYAIGEHGSKERDLDLIAAPWTEGAVSAECLAKHVADGLGGRISGIAEEKPAGRYAVNIQMGGWYKLIDLSICPIQPTIQP